MKPTLALILWFSLNFFSVITSTLLAPLEYVTKYATNHHFLFPASTSQKIPSPYLAARRLMVLLTPQSQTYRSRTDIHLTVPPTAHVKQPHGPLYLPNEMINPLSNPITNFDHHVHLSDQSTAQRIIIKPFLRDMMPFGERHIWEVIDREPQTQLANGGKVNVEEYGVLTLRGTRLGDAEWKVFRCVDKKGVARLEVAARRQWCENDGWPVFLFLC
jgi:hypothetical protein